MTHSTRSPSRLTRRAQSFLKWFVPGMGIKRWLVLLAFGIASLGFGLVYLIVVLYDASILPRWLYEFVAIRFLPPWGRVGLTLSVGVLTVGIALNRLSHSLLAPFSNLGWFSLPEVIYEHRRLGRGPHIVAIGGGTGLSTLLRGLKQHTSNLTAIITVADDGGSSGRLRRELGLPPPGDFRNCIAALANDEALITQLFQYRFGLGTPQGDELSNGELSGHSFGNLFIAAMTGITGSFEQGLEQSSEVLAIQGKILPSTLANVTLVADVREHTVRRVSGESHIPRASGTIERVYLTPEHAPAYPAAVRAILTADLVVLGPGSLYTSILPNLLVRGIRDALGATRAPVVLVCNIANQPGETDGYDSADFVEAIERHLGREILNAILVNDRLDAFEPGDIEQVVRVNPRDRVRTIRADLVDPDSPRHHDSNKLAKTLLAYL